MSYDAFQSQLMSCLKERFGESYDIVLRQIPKNNGRFLDGVSISPKGSSIAPTIYLQDLYCYHQNGASMDQILDEINQICHKSASLPVLDPDLLTRTDFVLPRIAFKLIHRKSNEALLEKVPFHPFLDLAMVCYLYLGRQKDRTITAQISHHELDMWELSEDDLFRIARQNTPQLFPSRIRSIREAMKEMTDQFSADILPPGTGSSAHSPLPQDLHLPPNPFLPEEMQDLYLLTNEYGLEGAAAMLYPSVLEDFARSVDSNLLIFPSSIHEVLLMPSKDPRLEASFTAIVAEINRSQVAPEERLSNQVYLFRRETGEITMLSHSKEEIL